MALADEPKITDWISAWSALGSGVIASLALVAALIAAWATIRTNKNQSEQLKRLEDAEARSLASQFAVWIDTDETKSEIRLRYRNAGPLPIYAPLLKFAYDGQAGSQRYRNFGIGTLSPTEEATLLPGVFTGNVEPLLPREVRQLGPLHPHNVRRYGVKVQFTDGNGTRWRRYSDGRLIELPPEPEPPKPPAADPSAGAANPPQ